MERLTKRKRNFDGTAISKKSMIDREGYHTVSDYASKVLTKLADYEDAEEQGLLLRLPCKVGDTVYHIAGRRILEVENVNLFFLLLSVAEGRFGKTVFLTCDEAEAKLAEMEGAE